MKVKVLSIKKRVLRENENQMFSSTLKFKQTGANESVIVFNIQQQTTNIILIGLKNEITRDMCTLLVASRGESCSADKSANEAKHRCDYGR